MADPKYDDEDQAIRIINGGFALVGLIGGLVLLVGLAVVILKLAATQ